MAQLVGVSRQTIYAIEADNYIPNTAVGLRLAKALTARVEDLFSLSEAEEAESRSENVTLLPSLEDLNSGDELHPGQPVQLCEVNGRLIGVSAAPPHWSLRASDAVISRRTAILEKAEVHPHARSINVRDRLLLAGCDPAMAILAHHLGQTGIELVLLHQNSSRSLSLLKRNHVHIAGTHLRPQTSGEPNISAIQKLFPAGSAVAISFARWEEGLVTARGNPKHIKGVEDLARRNITFINRELGSGSRLLLDRHLNRLKLDANRVRGYNRTAPGHLAAVWAVKTGASDCCIATEASARVVGLNFIPLEASRYDFVMRERDLKVRAMQALLDVMNRSSFRLELNKIGGYDTTVTGTQVL
ncbi:MAG: hypothetical protein JOZ48_21690 [Acidobacteriaceae bacterium]|nr:hypothetical protein [Acidobacteriaceae bacterium]